MDGTNSAFTDTQLTAKTSAASTHASPPLAREKSLFQPWKNAEYMQAIDGADAPQDTRLAGFTHAFGAWYGILEEIHGRGFDECKRTNGYLQQLANTAETIE
jgi:hypothetical protein